MKVFVNLFPFKKYWKKIDEMDIIQWTNYDVAQVGAQRADVMGRRQGPLV